MLTSGGCFCDWKICNDCFIGLVRLVFMDGQKYQCHYQKGNRATLLNSVFVCLWIWWKHYYSTTTYKLFWRSLWLDFWGYTAVSDHFSLPIKSLETLQIRNFRWMALLLVVSVAKKLSKRWVAFLNYWIFRAWFILKVCAHVLIKNMKILFCSI